MPEEAHLPSRMTGVSTAPVPPKPQAVSSTTPMTQSLISTTHRSQTRDEMHQNLREELHQNCSRTSVETFLGTLRIEGVEGTPGWKSFSETVRTDCQIKAHMAKYSQAIVEEECYEPFAAIANRITCLFSEHYSKKVRRRIRFVELGNKKLDSAISYHCEEEVPGTRSKFKPDGLAILLDPAEASQLDKIEGAGENIRLQRKLDDGIEKGVQWKDCVLNVEFKKRFPADPEEPKDTLTVRATDPIKKRIMDDDDDFEPVSQLRNAPQHARANEHPQFAASDTVDATADDIQLARNAVEVLCAVGNRAHTFGILINVFKTTLWFYDRSGAIRSEEFDFRRDIMKLARFLIAFSSMDLNDLGVIDIFKPPVGIEPDSKAAIAPNDLSGFTMACGNQTIKLGKILDKRFGLVGRGTLVHQGTMETEAEEDEVAVKMSWQVCTRTPEWVYVLDAINNGCPERHLLHVRDYMTWKKLSEGFRKKFKFLGLPEPKGYEDRELRILITELLHPVTNLNTLPEIQLLVWSTFHAVYHLNQSQIHHRDLSPGNIGYKKQRCGRILIKVYDFDHARNHAQEQSSQHFTGTLPYLAIDLLRHNDHPYLVRFDYESILWTSLWIVICYEDGKDQYGSRGHPLSEWFDPKYSLQDYAANKRVFLALPKLKNSRFEEARPVFKPLADCFRRGYNDQEEELDAPVHATLCGKVTSETLKDVLVKGTWYQLDQCSPVPNVVCNCPGPEER